MTKFKGDEYRLIFRNDYEKELFIKIKVKCAEERLKKRRQKNENTIKSFKEYLENSMKSTGLTKVRGNVFSLGIQNNPPSIQIEDENIIADDYIIMKQELDKKAMLRALKEGIEIPGASLKQTKSLRIR